MTTVRVIEHAITDTGIPTSGGKELKGNVLTFNNPVFNVANTKEYDFIFELVESRR